MRNPNQKPLLIAVVGFLLIFLGYFAGKGLEAWVDQKDQEKKQRSVPTNTWTEYKNSVYKYSIKHPKDLEVVADPMGLELVQIGDLSIMALDKGGRVGETLLDYVEFAWENFRLDSHAQRVSPLREVNISGNTGYSLTLVDGAGSSSEHIYLYNNDLVYSLTYPSGNEQLRTMTETFKFE
jgi:hypothetical protein